MQLSASFISRHKWKFSRESRGSRNYSVLHASPESGTGFPRANEKERKREREEERNGTILLNDATVHIGTSPSYSVTRATNDSLLCPLLPFYVSACLRLSFRCFRGPVLGSLFPVWARSWLQFNYRYPVCAMPTKLSA